MTIPTISCPHCGHLNEIYAGNLPPGTILNCCKCQRPVASWSRRPPDPEWGFQPLASDSGMEERAK